MIIDRLYTNNLIYQTSGITTPDPRVIVVHKIVEESKVTDTRHIHGDKEPVRVRIVYRGYGIAGQLVFEVFDATEIIYRQL